MEGELILPEGLLTNGVNAFDFGRNEKIKAIHFPQSMEAFFVGNNLSVTESTAEKNSTEKQIKSIAFPLEPIAFTTLFENGMNCTSMLIGFLSSSEASVLTSREKSPSSSEAIITEKKITAPLVLEPSSIAPTAPTANDGEGLTAKSKRC